MVSQVQFYLQPHQVVYIEYEQHFVCQAHPNKVALKIPLVLGNQVRLLSWTGHTCSSS